MTGKSLLLKPMPCKQRTTGAEFPAGWNSWGSSLSFCLVWLVAKGGFGMKEKCDFVCCCYMLIIGKGWGLVPLLTHPNTPCKTKLPKQPFGPKTAFSQAHLRSHPNNTGTTGGCHGSFAAYKHVTYKHVMLYKHSHNSNHTSVLNWTIYRILK